MLMQKKIIHKAKPFIKPNCHNKSIALHFMLDNLIIYKILVLGLVCCCYLSCRKDSFNLQETQLSVGLGYEEDVFWKTIFWDTDTAWVIGGQQYAKNTLLRSTDGGNTWQPIPVDANKALFDMKWIDHQRGFISSYDCKVLRTLDAGNTWQLYQGGTTDRPWQAFRGIDFANDTLGIIVGGAGNSSGVAFRTTNGGDTWQQMQGFDNELRDVQFVDQQTAFACGYGIVLKTTNGGLSWFPLDIDGDFFVALHFINPTTGWLVGNQGSIIKTTDGGYSWQRLRNGNSVFKPRLHFTDVHFTDTQNGYVLGNKLLWLTADGGNTFIQHQLSCDMPNSIAFKNENEALVVGTDGCVYKIQIGD